MLCGGPAAALPLADLPVVISAPSAPPPPSGPQARVFTAENLATVLAVEIARALGRDAVIRPEAVQADIRVGVSGAGEDVWLDAGPPRALTVAMRSNTDILSWADLRGRRLCFTETDSQAADLAAALGAEAAPQRAPAFSLMLVRTGECDAALHGAAQLAALQAMPEWEKFSATLPPRDARPLGIAVAASRPDLLGALEDILPALNSPAVWQARDARWARNVSLEVWLEQDAPDCH